MLLKILNHQLGPSHFQPVLTLKFELGLFEHELQAQDFKIFEAQVNSSRGIGITHKI